MSMSELDEGKGGFGSRRWRISMKRPSSVK